MGTKKKHIFLLIQNPKTKLRKSTIITINATLFLKMRVVIFFKRAKLLIWQLKGFSMEINIFKKILRIQKKSNAMNMDKEAQKEKVWKKWKKRKEKWKKRELRQIQTAECTVCMNRKSYLYTVLQQSVQARLSVHTNWIRCTYVFSAIPSSSILGAHLYTTPSSIVRMFVPCKGMYFSVC